MHKHINSTRMELRDIVFIKALIYAETEYWTFASKLAT